MIPDTLHDIAARAADLAQLTGRIAEEVRLVAARQLTDLSVATPDGELQELWLVLSAKRGCRR